MKRILVGYSCLVGKSTGEKRFKDQKVAASESWPLRFRCDFKFGDVTPLYLQPHNAEQWSLEVWTDRMIITLSWQFCGERSARLTIADQNALSCWNNARVAVWWVARLSNSQGFDKIMTIAPCVNFWDACRNYLFELNVPLWLDAPPIANLEIRVLRSHCHSHPVVSIQHIAFFLAVTKTVKCAGEISIPDRGWVFERKVSAPCFS